MRWPPPAPESLRQPSDVAPETYRVAQLRMPLWRHAFVALFEQVARRDPLLAHRFADSLVEATREYREAWYSSRCARRVDLRLALLILRRENLGHGKQRARHNWFYVFQAGRSVARIVTQWMDAERSAGSRLTVARQIAEELRPLGVVPPARISGILAAGRQPTAITARLLALAVYGRTGAPQHILAGVRSILDPEDHARPFEARIPTFLPIPSAVTRYVDFAALPRRNARARQAAPPETRRG